ncbi:MAG: hypothetical protein ACRDGO_07035 [Actinomycetota bacterium]
MLRNEHTRALGSSLLCLLGTVLGIVSYGTWAVRTFDFGVRQAVPGMDVGGEVTLALAVILLGAGLGFLFGVDVAPRVAVVAGSVAFVYSVVRAAQLGAEDIPIGHTTDVARALWIGITAAALTIPVALVRTRTSPLVGSAEVEPTG